MTDELTPVRCGCGGEAWTDYIIGELSEGVGWFVCCKNCEIQLPAEYNTEAEAIEAWNRAMGATDTNVGDKERTAKAKVNFKDENYFFGWCECGQYQSSQFPYCPACGCRLDWGKDDE